MPDHVPSYAWYQRHRRMGEQPCPACVEQNRIYQAAYRERSEKARRRDQKTNLSRARALHRLAERHREEFTALLVEEKRRLGL